MGLDEVARQNKGFNLSRAVHDPKFPGALADGFLWSAQVPGVPGATMVAGTRVHDAEHLLRAVGARVRAPRLPGRLPGCRPGICPWMEAGWGARKASLKVPSSEDRSVLQCLHVRAAAAATHLGLSSKGQVKHRKEQPHLGRN